MISVSAAQAFMTAQGIDAWILSDFRGSNPLLWHGLGGTRSTTRRLFLIIGRSGPPTVLAHPIDHSRLNGLPFDLVGYRSWQQMRERLTALMNGSRRIAVEYSPEGSVPTVSWVDAGTVDLFRSWGLEIVSSADLFQVSAAAWDDQALASHLQVCPIVVAIKDEAFELIRQAHRQGARVTDYDVQQFILHEFARHAVETENRPIVATNADSGNPHYEPTAAGATPIQPGDWILIDLWACLPGERNIFADITWVGFAGSAVPPVMQTVFEVVTHARDRVIDTLMTAWQRGDELQGWQLDQVARDHIVAAGYGRAFVHQTGHSLAPGRQLHGWGVNLDNLQTHDTRTILPRTGFSIEPGIYLPAFGVRSEVNAFVDPITGPRITTPVQRDVILLA
jgi:Xaa-Pro dipeptidase